MFYEIENSFREAALLQWCRREPVHCDIIAGCVYKRKRLNILSPRVALISSVCIFSFVFSITSRPFYVSPLAAMLRTVFVLLSHSLLMQGSRRCCWIMGLWLGCWMTVGLKSAGSPTLPQSQRNSSQRPSPQCPLVTHNKHPEETFKPQRV